MNNKYFNSLKINNNISFGFFTRNGGYSKGNFNSLNCSKSSGDTKVKIIKNIKKAQNQLELNSKFLKTGCVRDLPGLLQNKNGIGQ